MVHTARRRNGAKAPLQRLHRARVSRAQESLKKIVITSITSSKCVPAKVGQYTWARPCPHTSSPHDITHDLLSEHTTALSRSASRHGPRQAPVRPRQERFRVARAPPRGSHPPATLTAFTGATPHPRSVLRIVLLYFSLSLSRTLSLSPQRSSFYSRIISLHSHHARRPQALRPRTTESSHEPCCRVMAHA